MVKQLFQRILAPLKPKRRAALKLILIGIDYPSHSLAKALLERGDALIAFIDEEPWNHRTLMLGARIHYPSEILALATKHKATHTVNFVSNRLSLPNELKSELLKAGVNWVELDNQSLNLNQQISHLDSTTLSMPD